jgi:hypothetical protein
MGYTTDFSGAIGIEPQLNEAEIQYLQQFSWSRRMSYAAGSYCVDDNAALTEPDDFLYGAHNTPPGDQPGLWCNWEPSTTGHTIQWNGAEKFYDSAAWMKYLIDHFLKPDAAAKGQPGFELFTFDHVLNGTIEAQGEDPDDKWRLVVEDNVVKVSSVAEIIYSDPVEV